MIAALLVLTVGPLAVAMLYAMGLVWVAEHGRLLREWLVGVLLFLLTIGMLTGIVAVGVTGWRLLAI